MPFKSCVLFVLFVLSVLSTTAHAADEILLGMSTALTGPTAELGKGMRDGFLLGLERTNRAGGVQGRRLRLIVLDDGYEPARAAPNVRRLIEQEKVLAMVGNVGTPTAIATLPLARAQRTLFFAPFTGAGVLRREPPDRYVINYRASYAEEIGAMIDALLGPGGLQPAQIAFFTQRDGYGDAGYVGGLAALHRYGLADEAQILHMRYPRNTLAVENALADLLLAEKLPRAVIMVGAYAPCAKFIRLARQAGLDTLFLSVSFVGGDYLAQTLGPQVDGVIVTQVVPHIGDQSLPLVREYHEALSTRMPAVAPTFVGLEGYLTARLLVAALQRIEGKPGRETVVDALEGLGTFDLGVGVPLHLGPGIHQASHAVWPTRLLGGELLPYRWEDIGQTLEQQLP